MRTKILCSSMIFLLTSGMFIPLYKGLGATGLLTGLGLALAISIMAYFVTGSVLLGIKQWNKNLDDHLSTLQGETIHTIQKFDEGFTSKYDIHVKEIQNSYQQLAVAFQESLADTKATNEAMKGLLLENSKQQQEVADSFLEKTSEFQTSFQEETQAAKTYFNETQLEISKTATNMVAIAKESQEQTTKVSKNLNDYTDKMVHLFETRLEGEFQTLVQTKELIHESLDKMKELHVDSNSQQAAHLHDIEKKYAQLFDVFYNNQQDFNHQMAENSRTQKKDLLDILLQTKTDLVDVLQLQKEKTDEVSQQFLSMQQTLLSSNKEVTEHVIKQTKLGEAAEAFYTSNQLALNDMLKAMESIASYSGEQMKAVSSELRSFTTDIRDLFQSRLNEEYQILLDTKESIHQNLQSMTNYLTSNDEQVKDYLNKIGTAYQDLFHLLVDNQKKFNRSFDGHMQNLKNTMDSSTEDFSEEIKNLLDGQKRQTGDFISELLQLQTESAATKEMIQKQIETLIGEYDKNLQLTKNIQDEMMKLNQQDVELLSQLVGAK